MSDYEYLGFRYKNISLFFTGSGKTPPSTKTIIIANINTGDLTINGKPCNFTINKRPSFSGNHVEDNSECFKFVCRLLFSVFMNDGITGSDSLLTSPENNSNMKGVRLCQYSYKDPNIICHIFKSESTPSDDMKINYGLCINTLDKSAVKLSISSSVFTRVSIPWRDEKKMLESIEVGERMIIRINYKNMDNGPQTILSNTEVHTLSTPLSLTNTENRNGNNYCWLNAPLYVFVAFDEVMNLYNQQCPVVNLDKDTRVTLNIPDFDMSKIDYILIKDNADNADEINLTLQFTSKEKFDPTHSNYNTTSNKWIQTIIKNLKNLKISNKLYTDIVNTNQKLSFNILVPRTYVVPKDRIDRIDRELHKGLYELMKMAHEPSTVWDDPLYEKIHKLICDKNECKQGEGIMPFPSNGGFGNAESITRLFCDVLTHQSCLKNLIVSELLVINRSGDTDCTTLTDYTPDHSLIGFICGNNPIIITGTKNSLQVPNANKNKIHVPTHYISYVKLGQNEWKKYDSGRTNEHITYNLQDIFAEYPLLPNINIEGENGKERTYIQKTGIPVYGIYFTPT